MLEFRREARLILRTSRDLSIPGTDCPISYTGLENDD
jgi:hypothetical protein